MNTLGAIKHWMSAVARAIFYDNAASGLDSSDVQGAIDELNSTASPGFTWGRSGDTTAGTYLHNDTVPSNVAGRLVPLTAGTITTIFVACGSASTVSVKVQKRVGNAFTDLATVSLVAARTGTFAVTGASVALNDEIAVLVSAGSAPSVVVGVVIKGAL